MNNLKNRYTFIYFKDPEGRKKNVGGLEAAMEGRDAVAHEGLEATVRFLLRQKGMDLFFAMRLVRRVFSENRFLLAADFSIPLRIFMIFFLFGFGFGFGLLCFGERLV